jgi:hypothetical protein
VKLNAATSRPLDVMTPEEVVGELRVVTLGTLRYWRLNRTGPPWWKAGRRICYDRAGLLEWVEEQRRSASAPLHERIR